MTVPDNHAYRGWRVPLDTALVLILIAMCAAIVIGANAW